MTAPRRQGFKFSTPYAARLFAAALKERLDVSDIEVKGLTVWFTETKHGLRSRAMTQDENK